jgi:hypothetical protein
VPGDVRSAEVDLIDNLPELKHVFCSGAAAFGCLGLGMCPKDFGAVMERPREIPARSRCTNKPSEFCTSSARPTWSREGQSKLSAESASASGRMDTGRKW